MVNGTELVSWILDYVGYNFLDKRFLKSCKCIFLSKLYIEKGSLLKLLKKIISQKSLEIVKICLVTQRIEIKDIPEISGYHETKTTYKASLFSEVLEQQNETIFEFFMKDKTFLIPEDLFSNLVNIKNIQMIKIFLDNFESYDFSKYFTWNDKDLNIIKLIMDHPRFQKTNSDEYLLEHACKCGNVKSVELILLYQNIDPNYLLGFDYQNKNKYQFNNKEINMMLLKTGKLDDYSALAIYGCNIAPALFEYYDY
jgi:hypothetical protein